MFHQKFQLVCRFVFQVRENSPPATEVGRPTAEDRDVDPSYNRMSFYLDTSSSGANDDVGRLFRVDPDSGIIYTRQPLDREECSVYNMTIAVNSLSSSHKSVDLCYVTVNVLDVNDCAPIVIFPSATSNDSVRISALNTDNGNGPIATVIAVDRDIGANAKLSYNIAKWKYATSESAWRSEEEQRWHSGSGQFVINSTTGAINVLRTDTLDGAGETNTMGETAEIFHYDTWSST